MSIYNRKTPDANIHIAILYAHADEPFWVGLERHISVLLARHKNVSIWSVKDADLGVNPRKALHDELKRADISLLLLSADFITDEVINENTRQLFSTYAAHKEGERFIMPVLINHIYGWKDYYDEQYEIEHLKVFDAVSYNSDNQEQAFVRISKTLEEYIVAIHNKSIKIALPTWVGFVGGIKYNNGLNRSESTPLFQKYGRTIQYTLNDNIDDVCSAWLKGDANLIWATIDRLPYVIDKLKAFHPKVIFLAAWSNGADMIIGKAPIKKIEDLKGKRIAYPLDAPSRTFLLYVLNQAGLDLANITELPHKHENLDLLAQKFIKDDNIDALVLWSPYADICLNGLPGIKLLAYSGEYPQLISDVIIASQDYIDLNREELVYLFQGWLEETDAFTADKNKQKAAIQVLIDAIVNPIPRIIPFRIKKSLESSLRSYFEHSLAKIHISNLVDNQSYFGIGTSEKGAGQVYYEQFLQLLYPDFQKELAFEWEQIMDLSILKSIKQA